MSSKLLIKNLLNEEHQNQGYSIQNVDFCISPNQTKNFSEEETNKLFNNLKAGITACIQNPENFKEF